jgi:outer membrane protein assembly factor BamA
MQPDGGTAKATLDAPPDERRGGAPEGAPDVPEQPTRAKVTLEEWVPVRLRYGLELNDQSKESSDASRVLGLEPAASSGRVFGPGLASDISMRNLFGRAVSVGLAGRYTRDFRAARAYATAPAFFGFPITSNVFVTRSREELVRTDDAAKRFVTDTSGLTLEQRIRPAEKVEVAYSYAFERNHTFDLFANPDSFDIPFDILVNVARLSSAAIVDTRNDRIEATRGWLHLSDLEYAPTSLGSDVRFVKYLLQQRYYRTAGPVVLATSARLGLATAFGQFLLPGERFFAGGGNSVRGYDEDELSPRDTFGPVGGNALIVLNQEVRFPLFKFVRGVGFFDAGRAFDTVRHLMLTDVSAGTGLGVRIQTPIALFRVDYGVPLDRVVARRGRWFFSLGQAF